MAGVVCLTIVLILTSTSSARSLQNVSSTAASLSASPAFPNISYVIKGCYKDAEPRDMSVISLHDYSELTLEKCAIVCTVLDFSYAGVQNGSDCNCGQTYGSYGESENCNVPCVGEFSQICGGRTENTILEIVRSGTTAEGPRFLGLIPLISTAASAIGGLSTVMDGLNALGGLGNKPGQNAGQGGFGASQGGFGTRPALFGNLFPGFNFGMSRFRNLKDQK